MGYYDSFDVRPVFYSGYHWTPCDTIAPPFGIKIGGTLFNVSSADIIMPYAGWNGYKNRTIHYCQIAILPTTDDM